MNNRSISWAACAAGAVAVSIAGCANPFANKPSDFAQRPRGEALRTIDRALFDSDPVETLEEAARETPLDRPSPFDGLERVDLTIEQVRAWTLHNNLDIEVVLVDPAIANEALSEQEAAFEAVFFANLRNTDLDQATASTLESSQAEILDVDFGVRVPMRTGGTIVVDLPFNETNSDNTFNTLNPSYTANFALSLSQPLLRGAGRRTAMTQIRIADLNEGISEARTKLEVIRQIAAADRTYWRLYAAWQALDVTQRQFELAREQLQRAQRRVNAGDAPEIEVIRAEEGLSRRLEAIIVAENEVSLRQRDLKRIINVEGLDIETPIMLVTGTSPDPVRYDLDADALVKGALANRMELLELELRLLIDESEIAFQRNAALPLFTLDYTYRVNGLGSSTAGAWDQVGDNRFADWILGLTLEVPLGNEAAKARVQQALLARIQRLSSLGARELAVTQEVLDARDNIDSNWQRILASRQSSILSGRTLAGEERQFEVGRSTSNDVLDAATRLAEAQLAEIRALADYQIAQIDLAFATGTLLGASRVDWSPRRAEPTPTDPRFTPAPTDEGAGTATQTQGDAN